MNKKYEKQLLFSMTTEQERESFGTVLEYFFSAAFNIKPIHFDNIHCAVTSIKLDFETNSPYLTLTVTGRSVAQLI